MGSDSVKPKRNFEPFMLLFFYPGKTGFMAQRFLWMSKGFSGLQTVEGQNRRLRLGSMGVK